MVSGGKLLVQCLEAEGTDRVFCVPGESYLDILDALYDSQIEVIVARQEGGAAMMAEADGKATGRPGICMVTRGPGAANAMSGIHVAQQDSTPVIMIVGQVARSYRGRDAFQEVDFVATFGSMAKLVVEINDASRIPEIVARAFRVATSGRPGPVILSCPEDMLGDPTDVSPARRVLPVDPAPDAASMASFNALISRAARPVMIVGGSRWNHAATERLADWAMHRQIPVAVSFRRQHLIPGSHDCYAGDLGIGANPELIQLIKDSDLVILLGGRLSEVPSQNYTLLDIPLPAQRLIHIHPDMNEAGRVYQPALAIIASPAAFVACLDEYPDQEVPSGLLRARTERLQQAHESYYRWSDPRVQAAAPGGRAGVDLRDMMYHLNGALPDRAIVTNGAGNYSAWVHRFYRYRGFLTQFAPTSGSMGYGLPAAVAAALRFPDRPVVCFAGDGCLQMTINELGTVAQHQGRIIVIVIDNGMYGTIRMHQERRFPERVSGTSLHNPDFVALARAYGIRASLVEATEQFPNALKQALNGEGPALIHIKSDAEAITPVSTITQLRQPPEHP
ncbi:MAG: thiamine pyrophosphate-binding protein [Proteobacteria bacterium]|jgi:acetolactate synthase-1/2/3 large subunit|nr:thiamine pyrophosphate-binding protein [Pseudomonadota bacterium]MDA1301226.1 thiamine pyrophosphate-binding protein [Pseudomonadota bacterium]